MIKHNSKFIARAKITTNFWFFKNGKHNKFITKAKVTTNFWCLKNEKHNNKFSAKAKVTTNFWFLTNENITTNVLQRQKLQLTWTWAQPFVVVRIIVPISIQIGNKRDGDLPRIAAVLKNKQHWNGRGHMHMNWKFYFITIDTAHRSHNVSDRCPTVHLFVTEMCTHMDISVTKLCIVGYWTGGL